MKYNRSCGKARFFEAGVSLPETLVALVILMMVTVGVLSILPLSMNLTAGGRDYSLLTNTARDLAEMLLTLSWSDPQLAPGVHKAGIDAGRFTAMWRVRDQMVDPSSPVPPGREMASGNLKIISITVVATGGTGVGRRDLTVVVIRGRD